MLASKRLFFILLWLFAFTFLPIKAQELPIKWGEIPRSDLEMKSCPDDSNATAIYLCDYGESTFGDDLEIDYNRHVRVKILTAKGLEKGTIVAALHTGDGFEKISDIEGVTYNLNDKGEIVKTELKSKDIFQERVDDNRTNYRFAMPALTPGCVFELRFKIRTAAYHWWYMRGWTFQHDEPVRWSEYRMRFPKKIGYSIVKLGYERFFVDESTDTVQYFGGSNSTNYFYGQNIVPCWQYRWVLKDAPALRDEPYMTTIDDYTNRIDVQLSGFVNWNGVVEHVLTTWDKLAEDLTKDNNFLRCIKETRSIRKQTEAITAGLQTPEEKMIAIYNWIARTIVCSGSGIYAKEDLDDVLEAKKGKVADVTFLYLAMLKSAGIEGSPVLLSTRDNGILQESYPILSQFNYVIARVKIGDKTYFLVPSDINRPWDLLPSRVMWTRGFVVKEDAFEWVNITSPKKYVSTALANVVLDASGTIKGTLENLSKDYSALGLRAKLNKSKDIDVVKGKFDTELNGFTVDSVDIEGKDSVEQPVRMRAWISSSTYAQASGDMIYINPFMMDRYKENPFKSRTRKFPIDFPYQFNETMVYNIQIPDSFEVKEKVQSHEYYFRGDQLYYSVNSKVDGNFIQVLSKFQINTNSVKSANYEQLRDFYNLIVASQAEQIVLQKIPPPAPPVQEVKPVESKPDTEVSKPKVEQKKSAKKKSLK
jgi:hypothetical protein